MENDRSNTLDQDFVCPVCRAKQNPQPECRRCNADLSLYLKAKQSWYALQNQLQRAKETGDEPGVERAQSYLRWLSRQ
jgi:hypothetical protein